METVVMPKMGDTMEEGKILSWRKQVGEPVQRGDALAEIETEKVNIEAESFAQGVLRKILVPAGQSVPVGTPIALVGTASEPIPPEFAGEGGGAATAAANGAGAPEKPESQPGRPVYAQGQAEVAPELAEPQVIDQPVTAGQPGPQGTWGLQANAQQPAPAGAGTHAGTYAPPSPNGNTATAQASTATSATQTSEGGRIFISPIAKHIAQEHHLDIAQIRGTGPNGRIIREDVEAAIEAGAAARPAAQAPVTVPAAPSRPLHPTAPIAPPMQPVQPAQPAQPTAAAPAPAAPSVPPSEEYEVVPLSAMRKTIARRLQQSMQMAPHFYVTVSIDTTQLGELRKTVNEFTEGRANPVKISYNDLIVKGVALALRRMPQVNVSFTEDAILMRKRVNIGIAVALEQGLIVPVIRDADRLSLSEIARESQRLSEAARTGKLKPEEFSGGTFTVSNLGMFGVEDFTAVINPPEAAILAVAAIQPTPVAQDGHVLVRDRMKVTLSVDHRAIDGATAARFLQLVKGLLEEPMGLLV